MLPGDADVSGEGGYWSHGKMEVKRGRDTGHGTRIPAVQPPCLHAEPTVSARPVEDLSRCNSPRTRVSSSLVSLSLRARTSAMTM